MSANCYFFNPKTDRIIHTENELNFSNSNASDICAALGMETDFNNAAPTTIEDFRKKCESFLSGDLKHFIDKKIESKKDGNWMDCGRREGYLKEKIELLLSSCLYAHLQGAKLVYFS